MDYPPDVLGLSNYAWNHRISAEIFRIALKANPDIITVWGGPNFPADMISQEKFMGRYPEVNFYVPLEGEIGFSNIINEILNSKSIDDFKQLQHNPIENCVVRLPNNKIQYTIGSPRIKECLQECTGEILLYKLKLLPLNWFNQHKNILSTLKMILTRIIYFIN